MTTRIREAHARRVASVLLLSTAAALLPACGGSASASGGARSPNPQETNREPAAELRTEPEPPREAQASDQKASDHRAARVAGWVTLAIGIQATTVALVTSGMMLHEDSIRDSECNPDKRCTQAGIDSNENLQQLGTWNAGAWVVGLGGIAVGTVLLLLNPAKDRSPRPGPSRENEKKAGLVLGAPGGPGLGIQGTF